MRAPRESPKPLLFVPTSVANVALLLPGVSKVDLGTPGVNFHSKGDQLPSQLVAVGWGVGGRSRKGWLGKADFFCGRSTSWQARMDLGAHGGRAVTVCAVLIQSLLARDRLHLFRGSHAPRGKAKYLIATGRLLRSN